MRTKTSSISFILLALLLVLGLACKTSKTAKGAVIGGAAGGVIGGVIGKSTGNTAAGIIIGSAIGGSAGAVIGRYMDRQAREMDQKLENATVERVGEGILVTFKSGLLFDHNSYALRSETRANLQEMAGILQEYKDTELVIDGHTDATGSESYNQTLSERRAGAVSDYLASQGVARSRLSVHGYGEMKPVETNETESGRQANRRVEVAIIANDQLKRDAQDGAIGN